MVDLGSSGQAFAQAQRLSVSGQENWMSGYKKSLKDPSYVPSERDELSGDSKSSEPEEDSKPVNLQNGVKFAAFKEQMDKLLKRCPECGAAIRAIYSPRGMVARSQLAALDHNANTNRNHATVSSGEKKRELRYN
ncbi:hypothetical protein P5673_020386 [Acropora cervicornis]|uniref:Uncharacterized protein n=1 Tax=Acropora cervicornis TaxID=6130 RepID=A0AAD9Q9U8_ACRCE|nr:hypothetical protein P5673_020386 [Acropora cervicornis]